MTSSPTDESSRLGAHDPSGLVHLVFDHVGIALLVWDTAGQPTLWNKLATEWLGIGKGDQIDGNLPPHYRLLATDGHTPVLNEASPLEQAARGNAVSAFEFMVIAPGGTSRRLVANTAILGAPSGVQGTVLTIQEVALTTTDGQSMLQAKNEAETASAAKSRFLSSLTHELRTPLSSILGFAHLLAEEAQLPPEHASYLEVINKGGEHLLDIVNQALDLAKIEAGKHDIKMGSLAVAPCLREVVMLLRPRAEEKGLTIDATCEFDGIVQTDAVRWRQILVNLLSNAIKFTVTGSVIARVNVQSPRLEGGSSRLVLEVRDTGPGIAPEDLVHLFEPFYRGRSPSLQSGTGLGLTITRQFVELLGGTISVESSPGHGTSMHVELPVTVASNPVPDGGAVHIGPNARGCRVLVVEDQAPNALFLRKILERAGFEVTVAPHGQSGVELFQTWRPRFIWMDIMMPVMDGLEATRAIRALPGGRDVKIVAISARSFEADRAAAIAAGCDEFLSKPCLTGAVMECMARHLAVDPTQTPQGATRDISAIAGLPDPAKRELRTAVLSLQRTRMVQAIESVRPSAPTAAMQMLAFVDGYQFTTLLDALTAKTN